MKETYQKRSRPCFQHVRLQKNPSPFKRDIQKIPVKETYNPCTPCFQLVRLYVGYKSKRDIPKRHLENTCRSDLQSIYTLFSACPSSRSVSIKKKHSKETFQKNIQKRLMYGQKRPTDYLHLVFMFDMSSIQEKHSQETFERDIQRRSTKETYVYMKKRRQHVRLHVRSLFKRDIQKRPMCVKRRPVDC